MRWTISLIFVLGCGPQPVAPPPGYGLVSPPDATYDTTDDTGPGPGPGGGTTGTATDPGADFDGQPGTFSGTWDGRDYWLYVPTSYDPSAPAPLVMGFHGAGDNGGSFFAQAEANGFFAQAEAEGFLLLVPDSGSPYRDWANWSGNPMNDFGTMRSEFGEVLELVDDIGQTWHLDEDSVHGFGFSNGGLFLAVGGFAESDQIATASIFGYGWGPAYIVTPPRRLPVQMAVGSADTFAGYADQTASFLGSQGHEIRYERATGVGHSFSGLSASVGTSSLVGWMLDRPNR